MRNPPRPPRVRPRGLPGLLLWGVLLAGACDGSAAPPVAGGDAGGVDDPFAPLADGGVGDDAAAPEDGAGAIPPFAQRIVAFSPGAFAGYGADRLPDVVLGPPRGGGANAGGLDVLSLGERGCVVLDLAPGQAVDGEGPDLLVFENPFGEYFETGIVGVSADGADWRDFPCDATDAAGGFPGCAGTHYVYASPANGLDPTSPAVAGGDPFDLRDLGLTAARFVRICDSGLNAYAGVSGGFDLDAVSVVHAEPLAPVPGD
jgi:hypothetical protein